MSSLCACGRIPILIWSSFILVLSSNLRPTTRKCVQLVLLIASEDDGHIIRCAIFKNPMLKVDFMALCRTERGLLLIEVLQSWNVAKLLLWPWTCPNDLHIRTWPIFPGGMLDVQIWTFYVKAFEGYRLRDRQTDRQTRPKLCTTLLRGWSKISRSFHKNTFTSVFSFCSSETGSTFATTRRVSWAKCICGRGSAHCHGHVGALGLPCSPDHRLI